MPTHGSTSSIGNALDALHRALDGLAGADHPVIFNLACARRAIDAAILVEVRRMRAGEPRAALMSWAEIGADLGTSRQAAQQRFGAQR